MSWNARACCDNGGGGADNQTLSTTEVDGVTDQLSISNGNTVAINHPAPPTLNVTTTPMKEYRDIWAEENGAVNSGSAEWSFGNGATGFIGLPIDDGWEVEAIYFSADTYAANASVQVDLMDYGNVASNAAANTITSISLANSTDGGGSTNNAYKYEVLAAPVPITTVGGVTNIGFITRAQTGVISDARVGVRLCRVIADVVTSVSIA